eukprot:jgi/Ulvmu1/9485/UM052_0055.1
MTADDKDQIEPVEEVEDDEEDDTDDEDETGDAGDGAGHGRGRQSRSEKKARKAMQKLGMKPIPGVAKVTIRKSKNIMFVVAKPDVFKSPDSDTYIIFGEAKVEDFGAQAQAQAAQNYAAQAQAAGAAAPKATATSVDDISGAGAEDDDDVDAGDISEHDIDLVMKQAGASRAKAIGALRKQESDIVSAIMDLTMS